MIAMSAVNISTMDPGNLNFDDFLSNYRGLDGVWQVSDGKPYTFLMKEKGIDRFALCKEHGAEMFELDGAGINANLQLYVRRWITGGLGPRTSLGISKSNGQLMVTAPLWTHAAAMEQVVQSKAFHDHWKTRRPTQFATEASTCFCMYQLAVMCPRVSSCYPFHSEKELCKCFSEIVVCIQAYGKKIQKKTKSVGCKRVVEGKIEAVQNYASSCFQ